jgi:hypothetical protein
MARIQVFVQLDLVLQAFLAAAARVQKLDV